MREINRAAFAMMKQRTPLRSGVARLALAAALAMAAMSSGAIAAHCRGSSWCAHHLRGRGRSSFSRNLGHSAGVRDPWDWGGGWWAGSSHCGGQSYDAGHAPFSCYIYGGW
jgi:hypothetical protein